MCKQYYIAEQSSGKTTDFDSVIQWFESILGSQIKSLYKGGYIMDNKETKKDVPLATEIIKTLKKIIFALIITNVLTLGGFLWYISLPVDVKTEEKTITQNSDNASQNNYLEDTYNGSDTDSK